MPTQSEVLAPLPEQLRVVAGAGPAVEPVGHSADSPYLEAAWLEVLGPSTMLAWRRLARTAASRPGTVIGSSDLAQSLGLGKRLDENALLPRAVASTVGFGAANCAGSRLAVRTALPDVPFQQSQRLSMSAQLAHECCGHRQPRPASATPEPVGSEEVEL